MLLVYIFALIGEQLFANRFRFDPVTRQPISNITSDTYLNTAERPRANFDSLMNAVATTFQVGAGLSLCVLVRQGVCLRCPDYYNG